MIKSEEKLQHKFSYIEKVLGILVLVLLLLFSLYVRLINIDFPLGADLHAFRQTHTALAVQQFVNGNFSFANYELPLFGPPWRVPMEFPVYQTIAYFVSLISGIDNLDIVCRITGIMFFYLSALALYFLSDLFFIEKKQSICILLFYLFAPYNILWSRAAMPDYCSVFFGLMYAFLLIKWIREPQKKYLWILCLLTGILGYLSKSSTMIPVVILLIGLIIYEIIKEIDLSEIFNIKFWVDYIKNNFVMLVCLFLLCVLPTFVGLWWTKYSDFIKEGSPYTSFATSKALSSWNFGSFEQKTCFDNWIIIINRVLSYFMIGINVFFMFFGFIYIGKEQDNKSKTLSIFSVISVLLTIFILFNLYYVHDYYLMALSAFICILLGNGVFLAYESISKMVVFIFRKEHNKVFNGIVRIAVSLIIIYFASSSFGLQKSYLSYMTYNDEQIETANSVIRVGEYIQRITEETENVIVTDNDWSSVIPYYSNRKAYMYRGEEVETDFLKENNFTTLVTSVSGDSAKNIIKKWRYSYRYLGTENIWYYKLYDEKESIDDILKGYNHINLTFANVNKNQCKVEDDLSGRTIVSQGNDPYISYEVALDGDLKAAYFKFDNITVTEDFQIYLYKKDDTIQLITFKVWDGVKEYYIDLSEIGKDTNVLRLDLGDNADSMFKIEQLEVFYAE